MFYINFSDVMNFIDNHLEKSNHNYNDSYIDNFLDELGNYLKKINSYSTVNEISGNILFTLDRYEGNYAICENRTTGEMIDIPKSQVDSNSKDGDILKFENGIYQICKSETHTQKEFIENLFNRITN